MLLKVSLLVVLLASACNALKSVGLAAIWSPSASNGVVSYNSATMHSQDLAERLEKQQADLVVLLTTEKASTGNSILSLEEVTNSIRQSDATIATSLYQTKTDAESKSIHELLLQSKPNTQMNLSELHQLLLQSQRDLSMRIQHEHIKVSLDQNLQDPQMQTSLKMIHDAAIANSKKIIFLAIDEPTMTAPALSASYLITNADADVMMEGEEMRRMLKSNGNSNNNSSSTQPNTERDYRPAGTEFSIYHSGNYLYITPDILSGIITSFAIVFVFLFGLSQLSNIQGASTFTDEKSIPPIGKEN